MDTTEVKRGSTFLRQGDESKYGSDSSSAGDFTWYVRFEFWHSQAFSSLFCLDARLIYN